MARSRSNPYQSDRITGVATEHPTFEPRFLWTAQGPWRVTVLLNTGATHCFICARLRLAAPLGLRLSGQPGPTSVTTAAAAAPRGLAAPVLLHLRLGDTFRESVPVSPIYTDVDADRILGWDWISSRAQHQLYAGGRVSLQSGPALLRAGPFRGERPLVRAHAVGDCACRISSAPSAD